MTIDEKRERLRDYCNLHEYCRDGCLFYDGSNCKVMSIYSLNDFELNKALEIIDDKEVIENDKKSTNPYWDRITALATKQRETGIREYGRGLEDDTAEIDVRLNRISEELIDALMYIEHLRDSIKEVKND